VTTKAELIANLIGLQRRLGELLPPIYRCADCERTTTTPSETDCSELASDYHETGMLIRSRAGYICPHCFSSALTREQQS